MKDYSETDFFMDLSLVDDPYPFFEFLRAEGPVKRLPAHNVVAVTGFEEALTVLLDVEHYSAVNAVTGPLPPLPFRPDGDDITPQIEAHRAKMPFGLEELTQDPPRHTPLRSLMTRLFTPSRLRDMETAITRLADQLIDEIEGKGKCELAKEYGAPFATLAIAELLGVPEEDRGGFRTAATGTSNRIGARGDGPTYNPMDYRREKFITYVKERREKPQGDILSDLANAKYADGATPDAMDVVRVATLLFGAGQDTTATLVGNAMRIVAEQPDLQDRLRAKPALIPDFLEEVLRFSGPVKASFRLARKPTSLAGVDIPAGTSVMLAMAAINRDPRRYDDPADFKLGRAKAKEHLAFGRGIHTCPGAALARTEARISLERLLKRLDRIALDPEFHGTPGARRFEYLPTYVFRGLKALHLRFTPAA
jgi:cytochrome P450